MNVLVLVAHPDDEALGCGGTIARLASEGASIKLITFTDGISARENGDRRDQIAKSAKTLGIEEYLCLDYPDNMMDSIPTLSITREIESFVNTRDFMPDIILTHSPWCLNVDHRAVYSATITTFRGLSRFGKIKIMTFEVPSSSEWNPISEFRPNCFYDVSEHVSTKINALEAYKSEMREPPHPRSIENCLNIMKVNGSSVGLEFAEKFMTVREVI